MSDENQDNQLASTNTIIVIMIYLIVFSLFLLYGVIKFWPSPVSLDGNSTTVASVRFLTVRLLIPDELSLILSIAVAGAMGTMVHILRSFSMYVGSRKFMNSWIPFYILKPFTGSTLGLIFYFVIRGGLLSAEAGIENVSPFTFVGISCLVGMFSDQAIQKLKEVANSLFTELKPGVDHYKDENTEDSTSKNSS